MNVAALLSVLALRVAAIADAMAEDSVERAFVLAEDLECDWKKVRTEFAPINAQCYGGAMQGTFGSQAIRTSWTPMRRTGEARSTCSREFSWRRGSRMPGMGVSMPMQAMNRGANLPGSHCQARSYHFRARTVAFSKRLGCTGEAISRRTAHSPEQ